MRQQHANPGACSQLRGPAHPLPGQPHTSGPQLGERGGWDALLQPSPSSPAPLLSLPASPGLPWQQRGRQPMGPGRVRAARRQRGPLCGVAGDHGGGTKRGQGGSRVPFLRPVFSTPHNLSKFNSPLRALAVENSFMSTNPGRSKGRHRETQRQV